MVECRSSIVVNKNQWFYSFANMKSLGVIVQVPTVFMRENIFHATFNMTSLYQTKGYVFQ